MNLPLTSLLILASVFRLGAAEAQPMHLTRAADVRALDKAGASAHLPVRLRGVVTLPPAGRGNSFVIADDSAAVFCQQFPPMPVQLRCGDVVEVTGRSDMGGFAPFVISDSITLHGTGEMPEPAAVNFDQLATGAFDSQWVEVSGIVRRSVPLENFSSEWLIELATGGGNLKVAFRGPQVAADLVDAEIRVAGVCFYQFNKSGQIINPLLIVPPGIMIEVVLPPPTMVPLRRIDRLMSFVSDGFYGHRVRVVGVVTYHLAGEGFWLEEDGQGLRVKEPDGLSLVPGEKVEVTGFPVLGDYSPELEDVTVRRLADGIPAAPRMLKSSAAALDYDASLIRLDAALIEQVRVPRGMRFIFRDDSGDFTAHLRMENGWRGAPAWETESSMRVTGICQISKPPLGAAPGTLLPREFELILRSPADLLVLRTPPWWNAERRASLFAMVTVALGLIVGFVIWQARRRLRQSAVVRKQSEAEFSAILAERNRIAREIHDTLAQGLGAISMHLEVARGQVSTGSSAAAHLAEASSLTRDSLREARNSIWNMRCQVLEHHDLAGALAGVLDQLTELDDIEARFIVTGDRFRLSPVAENNLLRIGQEAISNAVKHAEAKHIEVTLGFSKHEVSICVKDDGCGFDPDTSPADGLHFGIVGLRERAQELGATLRLESTPGGGTKVILNFPVTPPETGFPDATQTHPYSDRG
jgi:signal transduction histidine kinase